MNELSILMLFILNFLFTVFSDSKEKYLNVKSYFFFIPFLIVYLYFYLDEEFNIYSIIEVLFLFIALLLGDFIGNIVRNKYRT